jgi:hypothetical protein
MNVSAAERIKCGRSAWVTTVPVLLCSVLPTVRRIVAFFYLGSTYALEVEEEISYDALVTFASRYVVISQNTGIFLKGKAESGEYSFRLRQGSSTFQTVRATLTISMMPAGHKAMTYMYT